MVSLVGAALFVFFALQDAFDEIWEVPVADGITRSIRRRLLAFAVVGGGGVVIVLLLFQRQLVRGLTAGAVKG